MRKHLLTAPNTQCTHSPECGRACHVTLSLRSTHRERQPRRQPGHRALNPQSANRAAGLDITAKGQLDSPDMALDGIGPSFAQLFGVSARVSAPPYSFGHPWQQNTYHAFHDLMHVLP